MSNHLTRRRVLGAIGSGSTSLIAGCETMEPFSKQETAQIDPEAPYSVDYEHVVADQNNSYLIVNIQRINPDVQYTQMSGVQIKTNGSVRIHRLIPNTERQQLNRASVELMGGIGSELIPIPGVGAVPDFIKFLHESLNGEDPTRITISPGTTGVPVSYLVWFASEEPIKDWAPTLSVWYTFATPSDETLRRVDLSLLQLLSCRATGGVTTTESKSGNQEGDEAAIQPTDGLVGYWPFEAVSGQEVPDKSRHGHTGRVRGNPTQITGAVEQALRFDGQDDAVVIDMTPELQTPGSFTIEHWLRTTTSTTGSKPVGLYTYDGSGQGEGVWINAKSSSVSFSARHSSGYGQSGGGAQNDPYYHIPGPGPTISPGQWHHVALRHTTDEQAIELYVDGSRKFSLGAPKPPRVDQSFMSIGARPKSERNGNALLRDFFKGAVDEVAVYTQALSPETIQQHAERG